MVTILLGRGECLESDRSETWRGASSAVDGWGGGGGRCYGKGMVKGCDWPRHTASKSCQIVLLKGDSDPISFRTV